jgi:hypothetical protein
MGGCNEHIECLQERIEDYRQLENIGIAFVSIGLSLSIIPTYATAGAILGLEGALLLTIGELNKREGEAKLHELLKRLSESKKEG